MLLRETTVFSIFSRKVRKKLEKLQEEDRILREHRYNQEGIVIKAWKNKVFSDKYLSVYDRYTLEFVFRTDNQWSDDGLYYNLLIYNQDLDVVYDFKRRLYDFESDDVFTMNQRRLELEYWLNDEGDK